MTNSFRVVQHVRKIVKIGGGYYVGVPKEIMNELALIQHSPMQIRTYGRGFMVQQLADIGIKKER